MAELRILSANLWKCDTNQPAWAEKGFDCSVNARAPGVARILEETAPDVIGLQEISARMTELVQESLTTLGKDYAVLWGRDTPIWYRADRLELVDSRFAIYDEELPGHGGSFNNGKTKSRTIAVFRVKENGRLFVFASTHLWWKSDNPESKSYQPFSGAARTYQLGILADEVDAFCEKHDCPGYIVGDLNAVYSSEAIQSLLTRGYLHAHDIATAHADETRGHHMCGNSGFDLNPDPGTFEQAIDHILCRGIADGTVRNFVRAAPEWYMPISDHMPVYSDIIL